MVKKLIAVIVVVLLLALYFSFYTVKQTQQAIVLKLGQVELNAAGQPKVLGPGPHFQIPLLETIVPFDMRLQSLSIDSSRVMTSEQKEVMVTAYVKWRINNIVQYYTSTSGNAEKANLLLHQKVNDELRAVLGQYTIQQLLTDQQRIAAMATILNDTQQAAQSLGIQVVDVRIMQIDLPDAVADKIYARMSSARENIAAGLIASGKEQAEIIRAKADAQVTVTLAKARNQAANIRAEGDGKAALIAANAYQQNPQFYDFYRSLQAYQATLGNAQDTLVLQPKGQFFQYFNPSSALRAG